MSVTAPRGFRASGVAAGLKAAGGRDVALVVNDGPLAVGAAVLTSNRVQAAPVLWSRQAIADGGLSYTLPSLSLSPNPITLFREPSTESVTAAGPTG